MIVPKRTINLRSATGVVIANMIGSGIFVTAGIIAGKLPGPIWVLSLWIIGGIIALLGALCYSELATRMPVGGGEYVYLSELYSFCLKIILSCLFKMLILYTSWNKML